MASPYDLVPWLQGTPDEPAKIFLQGAAVGSQMGQGAVANINRARAINEEARQFDEQQQRLAQFDQVRQGIQQYQLEEAQLQVQKMKLAKDYEFQTSKAEIEIGNLLNTTAPTDPTFRSKLGGIASRYPAVMRSDVFKHAAELPLEVEKLAIDRIRANRETTPNAADEAAISKYLHGLEVEDVMKGKPRWTDIQRVEMENALRKQKEFNQQPKGTTMRFNDQGVLQQVDVDGGAGDPTIATASRMQGNLNIAEKNMQLLNDLSTNLRGKDLGIAGNLGEIVDRWAPQFGLPGFDKQRATNRESLKVAVQGMVRQISSDQSRFSEGDRKRAEAAMVRPGWDENEQNARAVLEELRDIVRNRAKVDASTLGTPIPEWALSSDDIIDAVRSGKMTREKGMELRLKYHRDKFKPQ